VIKRHSAINIILALLLAAITITIILLCAVPPVSRDALTHHLAVPKLYLSHGGIYEIPSIVFSYYPMNLDLLYWLSLYLGSDIAPKYIHFAFAIFTALLIFKFLKDELGVTYGLSGALFFLTIPVIVKLSITAYVDLGLIFFSTAALLTLLAWVKNEFKWRYLFLSSVSCGLAMGTKYNGLIVFFCLAMFVPLIFLRFGSSARNQLSKLLSISGIYTIIALLFFSPWMIKNYIWTKNPIYPLYNSWFNSGSDRSQNEMSAFHQNSKNENEDELIKKDNVTWNHLQVRKVVYQESLLDTLLIPLRVFFQGQDDNPKYFDGKLNPFLLLLPFVAFLGFRSESKAHQRDFIIFVSFSVLYLLFVYVQTDMRIRWIAPIIPSLVILSIFGLRRLLIICNTSSHTFGRSIFGSLVFIAIVLPIGMNLNYIYGQFLKVEPLKYIGGGISRGEYITHFRPEYPVIAQANQTLAPDAKILAIYLGRRIYYSDRRMDCNYTFFFDALGESKSELELYDFLLQNGVTHLLIRFDLFQYHMDTMLDGAGRDLLKRFFQKHLHEIYVNGGHGLFALTKYQ
jgi:hypothetical protein